MSAPATLNSLAPEELLRLQTFAPLLNSAFEVARGGEWVPLDLAVIEDNAAKSPRAGVQNFSLIFAAGPEKPLQQGIHDFRHSALGAFELFIVPVQSPHPELRWYQAIINRDGVI